MRVNLIVAVDNVWGIGKNNSLPWNIKEDLRYFSKITKKTNNKNRMNVVVMGRNTWDSIPESKKPLKNRINIVISSKTLICDISNNIRVIQNLKELESYYLKNKDLINEIFIIGGSKLYESSIKSLIINRIYLTRINHNYNCDVYFPFESLRGKLKPEKVNFNTVFCETIKQNVDISFDIYNIKYNEEEQNYLNLIKEVIKQDRRETRNGFTYSMFGGQLKFNLENGFPLLTTKKMFLRGIIEELLFFIRGDTNSKILSDKKVKIWDPNTSREFLDKRNLKHYEEGDMGPMYGWQWRHFGEKYNGMNNNYRGFDQLKEVIKLIKKDPMSRRIMMTTFNPLQLKESVLAPCHSLILQFYVSNNYLSCHMYQRSADIFLGVPFNIASTSLLLSIIANATGLKAKDVIISFGDIHLYEEHINQGLLQINRRPFFFPKLNIKKDLNAESIDEIINNLENLCYNDFSITNYNCYDRISAKMIA